MVIASLLVTSPLWLHTLGQIAGTLLLVELLLALAIVCALMGGLAYAAWWMHRNVIPVIDHYGQQAQQVMGVAERSGERIVGRVATFHGAQAGIFTGLRVFLFGRPQPQREVVHLPAEPAPVASPVSPAPPAQAVEAEEVFDPSGQGPLTNLGV
jgi:hypothetical protein